MPRHADGKRRRMRKLRIEEISAVDAGAQSEAGAVILKRRDGVAKVLPSPRDGESRADFVSRFMGNADAREEFPEQDQRAAVANRRFRSMSKRAALTTEDEGHSHLIGLDFDGAELSAGETGGATTPGDEFAHFHPWVRTEDGDVVIGASNGHTHTVDVMSKARRSGMADKDKKAAPDTAAADKMAKVEAERDELRAKTERLEKVAALPADQRAHFDALEKGDDQDAFLKLEQDARKAEVAKAAAKAKDANPVVWTATDGTEYRKNDDPRVVEMAKRHDQMASELAKAKAEREDAVLAKRADTELGHLRGKQVEKVALLKAIDTIGDEETRAAALQILKSHDGGLSDALKTMGVAPSSDDGDPQIALDTLAKRHAEEHECTTEQAYAKVLQTPEGKRLYALSENNYR